MPTIDAKEFINSKIIEMKNNHACLRGKSDDYVFSALCLKNNFYKNPSITFNDDIMLESLVDGVADGGVDILLSDPNSETSDLVLCQSKYYENISYDEMADALHKLIDFYKDMEAGRYGVANSTVQRRFITLNSEVGDESKIIFVLYTSSQQNRIRVDKLKKVLKEAFNNDPKFDLNVYFGKDIVEEIIEAESRRPYVENGKLKIDKSGNYLLYGEGASIVNISAFSLKELYAIHNTNLLSRNLRYYIKKKDIDDSIDKTINEEPDKFWYMNNGLTILCDDYEISGTELKIKNFSIVNGGQTTTLIYRNATIDRDHDFYLPCKVILIEGDTEDQRSQFSLDVSKATNSQKAIKSIDLKANAPEQVRFVNAMRQVGVFYQTKRGEPIPNAFKLDYNNSDLAEIGKLCLAGIYQLPATSRSKPSTMYSDQYYNQIFNSDQSTIAQISRDLLYVDYYFRKIFIKKFDVDHANEAIIPFAHNSRTICLSFITLASRYINGYIDNGILSERLRHVGEDRYYENYFYDFFGNLGLFKKVFTQNAFENKDELDSHLYVIFSKLISEGSKYYNFVKENDPSLNETNFLKNDTNYYKIIKNAWSDLVEIVRNNQTIFKED